MLATFTALGIYDALAMNEKPVGWTCRSSGGALVALITILRRLAAAPVQLPLAA
jgi:hypothetical protein